MTDKSLWSILKQGLLQFWGFEKGKRKVKIFIFYIIALLVAFNWSLEASDKITAMDGFKFLVEWSAWAMIALFVGNIAENVSKVIPLKSAVAVDQNSS